MTVFLMMTLPIDNPASSRMLVLASNNQGKLTELQRLCADAQLDLTVVPQSIYAIPDAVEDGLSFIENALIKARHAARLSGHAAIADDSGLVVPILKGAPGIYSARYSGVHGDDAANNQKLLQELAPYRQGAPIIGQFVCVLAWVRHADDPLPIVAQGIWQGEILSEPRGEHGFGYDPLFWLPELGLSSAELDKHQKNKISHRGQAMQQLLAQLDASNLT